MTSKGVARRRVTLSDSEITRTYSKQRRLVTEHGKYASGEYHYHRVDLACDKLGRLLTYTSRYSDSEDARKLLNWVPEVAEFALASELAYPGPTSDFGWYSRTYQGVAAPKRQSQLGSTTMRGVHKEKTDYGT